MVEFIITHENSSYDYNLSFNGDESKSQLLMFLAILEETKYSLLKQIDTIEGN